MNLFLSLTDFLEYFPKINITKNKFIKKTKIMYKTPVTLYDLFSLKHNTVIKSRDDLRYIKREEIIDYLYELIITNRHKYLTLWYNAYFEYKKPNEMIWDNIDIMKSKHEISVQKNDESKHLIRNLFYLELFDTTQITNTVKNHVSFWQSLLNMYNKLEIEDRFFCPSSVALLLRDKKNLSEQKTGKKDFNYNIIFYLYQQYQPKASIFNPYTIKFILSDILMLYADRDPVNLFSPVLSWGSYIPGFMHIKSYKHYVGVDVMPTVCKKALNFANWYCKELQITKKVDILCTPSEKLSQSFKKKYYNYFDTIIMCPPYFDMEVYPEGEQSVHNYPDYETWLQKYYEETIKTCFHIARSGAIVAIIANDYYTLSGRVYNLTEDFHNINTKYFNYLDTYYLVNRTSPLRMNKKNRTERLFIYKKI